MEGHVKLERRCRVGVGSCGRLVHKTARSLADKVLTTLDTVVAKRPHWRYYRLYGMLLEELGRDGSHSNEWHFHVHKAVRFNLVVGEEVRETRLQ